MLSCMLIYKWANAVACHFASLGWMHDHNETELNSIEYKSFWCSLLAHVMLPHVLFLVPFNFVFVVPLSC